MQSVVSIVCLVSPARGCLVRSDAGGLGESSFYQVYEIAPSFLKSARV